MFNPKISIICPIYNGEKYISETIESVLKQTLTSWELIITDDGSTDDSILLIKRFQKKDNRILLLENTSGKGPGAARNNSIKAAKGNYIAFIDADDLWLPTKLEEQLHFMEINDYNFSFTSYVHFDDENESLKEIHISDVVDYKALLKANSITTSTVMYKKADYEGVLMPDFPRAQDFAFWLRMLRSNDKAYGLDKILCKYRLTPNTGNRKKIYALKYLYDIYTKQENMSSFRAFKCILEMFVYRTKKYK